jgi:hypothetical protein
VPELFNYPRVPGLAPTLGQQADQPNVGWLRICQCNFTTGWRPSEPLRFREEHAPKRDPRFSCPTTRAAGALSEAPWDQKLDLTKRPTTVHKSTVFK